MVDGDKRSRGYFASVARGMQPTGVRLSNQRAVLTVVSMQPGISNAGIARRTGLAPQTVSAVLDNLEQAGLLLRGEARRGGGRGQPATPLYVDPLGAYALGAEIGGDEIEVALVNLDGKVIGRDRQPHPEPELGSAFPKLAAMSEALIATLPNGGRDRLIGVGLATAQRLHFGAVWTQIDVQAAAARATGLDVQVFNNGNAACWAEFVAHASPRPGNFVLLLIDSCVAAGIISEDHLWEGPTGSSANLGSMLVLDRHVQLRTVNDIASIAALKARLEAAGVTLAAIAAGQVSAAAQSVVDEWVADAGFTLAQTILNLSSVVELEFAAIEVALPAPIGARLVNAVRQRSAEAAAGPALPEIRQGHLGQSGAAQGAALIRLYRRFFSRELEHMDAG